jgi:hypothetical protein
MLHHIIDLGLQQFVEEKGNIFYALLCVCKRNSFCVHLFYFSVFYSMYSYILPVKDVAPVRC